MIEFFLGKPKHSAKKLRNYSTKLFYFFKKYSTKLFHFIYFALYRVKPLDKIHVKISRVCSVCSPCIAYLSSAQKFIVHVRVILERGSERTFPRRKFTCRLEANRLETKSDGKQQTNGRDNRVSLLVARWITEDCLFSRWATRKSIRRDQDSIFERSPVHSSSTMARRDSSSSVWTAP